MSQRRKTLLESRKWLGYDHVLRECSFGKRGVPSIFVWPWRRPCCFPVFFAEVGLRLVGQIKQGKATFQRKTPFYFHTTKDSDGSSFISDSQYNNNNKSTTPEGKAMWQFLLNQISSVCEGFSPMWKMWSKKIKETSNTNLMTIILEASRWQSSQQSSLSVCPSEWRGHILQAPEPFRQSLS